MQPEKIAILGGGVGSVVTAFALTEVDDWQDKYDITLYQMGWRLGGKGASGRNPDHQMRIEEHGLHIWLGFYENAFQAMQRAYKELGREPTAPLATWDMAFKQHSYITIQENIDEIWHTWNINFPVNPSTPGDGSPLPSIGDYMYMLVQLILNQITGVPLSGLHEDEEKPSDNDDGLIKMVLRAATDGLLDTLRGSLPQSMLANAARAIAQGLRNRRPGQGLSVEQRGLIALLEKLIKNFIEEIEEELMQDTEARRAFILADLAFTILKGMIVDGVIINGFDVINDKDFAEWLGDHGAADITVNSAVVRAWYDLVFGFPNGDTSKPGSFEAGTSLRAIMRLAFTYKGAIFWEMQAGMGDTVFTPFYQVLKRRGVKFKFFHKVKNLALSADKKSIESIDIGVQATVKPTVGDYDPLVEVKGLECWPSVPKYKDLVQGTQLKSQNINLESSWTPWQDISQLTLQKGVDFDKVVLGIAVGALPDLTPELMAASTSWNDMVTNLKTVQTLALQLWLRPDLEGLGWPFPKTVMTAYADQFNTWSDMTHLLNRECWPPDHFPFNLAYFCGPMSDADVIPPYSDHAFPAKEYDRVKNKAINWLNTNVQHIWKNATDPNNPVGLDYDHLIDPSGATGQARLDSQYWRANIDPTERYVISVPNSTKYRLKADGTDFDNLYIAGDWTVNGLNAGCVEAATISGLMCSRAISGYPQKIYGEYDDV